MSIQQSVEERAARPDGAAYTVGLGWGAILAVTDAIAVNLVISLITPGEDGALTLTLLVLLVLMPVVGALFASGYRPAGRAEVRRVVGRRADQRESGTLTGLERGLLDRRLAIAIGGGIPAVAMVLLATALGLTAPVTVAVVLACWFVNTVIVRRLV